MSSTCRSCGEGAVVSDPDSGALVCTSCGLVHDAGAAEFVNQATFNDAGGLDLRVSSLVRHHSDSAYRDNKLAGASAAITSIAARLGLSPARAEEALRIAKSATDGNLVTPGAAFLPALAAACTLLVARSHRLPLSLAEAAEAAFCSAPSLADLVSRVAAQLSLPPLPCFDYAAALDRAVRLSPSLTAAAGEKTEAILAQARFLLRCATKWSLTTGRYPLPLVAGLVAFSAEVNEVTSLSVEDIARDISAAPRTSLRRYKELVDALVHVARQLLPWGADVNAKNLLLNAPVLLRLMEMRSQSHLSEQFLEGFAPDMAGIVQAYSSVDDDESRYLQVGPSGAEDFDFENSGQERKELEDKMISEKCLSDAYQNVLKRLAQLQELGQVGKGSNKRKQWRGGLELEPWMDSTVDGWKKDVVLEEVVDIDIGYDAPPPSFTAGMELRKKRRARMETAKQRIDAIRKAPAAPATNANHSQPVERNEDACPPQKLAWKKQGRKKMDGRYHIPMDNMPEMPAGSDVGKKKWKRVSCDGIDWEDCIIELLLLHGANEVEIEQGQYRRLLELHVFRAVSGGR
ncbi:plant-specific TFIIB-related protein PTF2-like [Phragmites australis]|uniref:plant-specific TFIIB-related protein PTF2-like n=1 Tax=Phragmites australis TaxID=29695 RepID=UPI002D782E0F|nr:plant-specific TFIIB-related protein PTF2-like [Phragmites australis]XP_062192531.1 plant-specific TFIIB-related protein PTF2-like [Phragmites australis]XP_062192532.1 plant-specific TFIIB-related protein PTF2-like [Phragmites australis]